MVSIKAEHQLGKHFSIGLGYSKLTASTEQNRTSTGFLFFTSTETNEKIESEISGLSLDMKVIVYSNDALQAYVGTALGILKSINDIDKTVINRENRAAPITSRTTENSVTGLTQLNVGTRYFVTKDVGFYGEIGLTAVNGVKGASGQAGVICRF